MSAAKVGTRMAVSDRFKSQPETLPTDHISRPQRLGNAGSIEPVDVVRWAAAGPAPSTLGH